MNQSGSQATEFYKQVALSKKLWTVRDHDGFPAPLNSEGKRAQPFWSSLSRIENVISNVKAYSGFEPYELSWEEFSEKWVPGLTRDKILVGVNWSGRNATGYDIEPEIVRVNVETLIVT